MTSAARCWKGKRVTHVRRTMVATSVRQLLLRARLSPSPAHPVRREQAASSCDRRTDRRAAPSDPRPRLRTSSLSATAAGSVPAPLCRPSRRRAFPCRRSVCVATRDRLRTRTATCSRESEWCNVAAQIPKPTAAADAATAIVAATGSQTERRGRSGTTFAGSSCAAAEDPVAQLGGGAGPSTANASDVASVLAGPRAPRGIARRLRDATRSVRDPLGSARQARTARRACEDRRPYSFQSRIRPRPADGSEVR